MGSLFAFSEIDLCGWICVALPLALLSVLCVCRFIRWWNMQPVNKCPRCWARPTSLDVYNVCWDCGCEYDKWGCILREAVGPPLDELDLARFSPGCYLLHSGKGSAEFKSSGEVHL
jgi:hypothetical protein